MQQLLPSVLDSLPVKASKLPSAPASDSGNSSFHKTLLRQKASLDDTSPTNTESTEETIPASEAVPSTDDEASLLWQQQLLAAALTAQLYPVLTEESVVPPSLSAASVAQISAPLSEATPLRQPAIMPQTQTTAPSMSQLAGTDVGTPASLSMPTPSPTPTSAPAATVPPLVQSSLIPEPVSPTLQNGAEPDSLTGVDMEKMVLPTEAAPLFSSRDSIPVKVGEPLALDTQSPDMDAQLSKAIVEAADRGITRLKVHLSPEALGNISIEISHGQDGTLRVALSAVQEHAQSILDRHSTTLQSLLASSTRAAVQVEVLRQPISQPTQQEQPSHDQGNQNGAGQQQQSNHRQQQDSQQRQEQDFLQRLRLGLTVSDTETA